MPTNGITMRQIRQALRVLPEAGLSYAQVARAVGIGVIVLSVQFDTIAARICREINNLHASDFHCDLPHASL